ILSVLCCVLFAWPAPAGADNDSAASIIPERSKELFEMMIDCLADPEARQLTPEQEVEVVDELYSYYPSISPGLLERRRERADFDWLRDLWLHRMTHYAKTGNVEAAQAALEDFEAVFIDYIESPLV